MKDPMKACEVASECLQAALEKIDEAPEEVY